MTRLSVDRIHEIMAACITSADQDQLLDPMTVVDARITIGELRELLVLAMSIDNSDDPGADDLLDENGKPFGPDNLPPDLSTMGKLALRWGLTVQGADTYDTIRAKFQNEFDITPEERQRRAWRFVEQLRAGKIAVR